MTAEGVSELELENQWTEPQDGVVKALRARGRLSGKTWEQTVVQTGDTGAGVVAVILAGDEVLLGRHPRLAAGGVMLELPRGSVNADESADEAVRREVLEETGLELSTTQELGVVFADTGVLAVPVTVFVARTKVPEQAEFSSDDEFSGLEWMPVSQIPQLFLKEARLDGLTLSALCLAHMHGAL
jgi:ADP-ribose pyrophosphatase